MERYLLALEAFESETHDIYADYLMGQMIAIEGFSGNIGARIKSGWDKVRQAALWLWNLLVSAVQAIGAAVGRFRNVIRKAPKKSTAKPEDIKDVKSVVAEQNDLIDKATENLQQVMKFAEEYQRSVDNMDQLEELDRVTMEFLNKNGETFKSFDEFMKNSTSPLVFESDMSGAIEGSLDELKAKREKLKAESEQTLNEMDKIADRSRRMAEYAHSVSSGSVQVTDVSDIAQKLDEIMNDADVKTKKVKDATEHVKRTVESASNASSNGESESEEVKKATLLQRIGSRILRMLGVFSRFFTSIPKRVTGWLRKIFPPIQKTRVKDYDGPAPEIG